MAAQMSEEATDVYEVAPNWPQPNPDCSQSLSRVAQAATRTSPMRPWATRGR